jgi:hypothetical protein
MRHVVDRRFDEVYQLAIVLAGKNSACNAHVGMPTS